MGALVTFLYAHGPPWAETTGPQGQATNRGTYDFHIPSVLIGCKHNVRANIANFARMVRCILTYRTCFFQLCCFVGVSVSREVIFTTLLQLGFG